MNNERIAQPLVRPVEQIGSTALHDMKAPTHNVYRGGAEVDHHSFERGFTDFEAHMNMIFPAVRSLDAFIEGRIDKARKTGRDVVVVDLGAGSGNFTRQPLLDPAVLARSRKRLAGKMVGTHVQFYSVADAPSAQDHLRMTTFREANLPENEQFEASEVNYSVSSSQTVRKLLTGLQEESADLIVASNFLQYLRPQVFAAVLQDSVDVLRPGGRFMAFGYATIAGRFLSRDDGYTPADEPAIFMDSNQPDGHGVTGDELRIWGRQILTDRQTTDAVFKSAIESLRNTLFASDYYAQPSLGDFRGYIKRSLDGRLACGESPKQLLTHMLDNILPVAEDNERIQIMKQVKDEIIDDIALKNAGAAVVQRARMPNREQGYDAVLIKKRVESNKRRN